MSLIFKYIKKIKFMLTKNNKERKIIIEFDKQELIDILELINFSAFSLTGIKNDDEKYYKLQDIKNSFNRIYNKLSSIL